MTCMTTKQKFEVETPEVVVLNNGRYAYRAKCPWTGAGGKELYAFKFASTTAHQEHVARQNPSTSFSEHSTEQDFASEEEA